MTRIPTIKVRIPRTGEAHRGRLSIGSWETPCVVGTGGLVPASLKREGDRRTPVGVFPLRYGFFDPVARPDFPRDLAFPFVPLSEAMIWEEDGADYNRLVLAAEGERTGERLSRRRDEGLFDLIVPIGFNDAVPEAGRGSALFIHVARADGRGTAGCIGVPRDALTDLARRLEPGMVVDIGHEDEVAARPREDGPLEMARFVGLQPGPRLLVLGAVHGNEPCGPEAIRRAIADCQAGRLAVRRGEVTFVPVVNLKAYRQNTREGDRNLNRDLRDKTVPQDHEDRIGNRLCALLRQHDALLDIHSFRGEGEPFVFAGPEDNRGEVEPFAKAAAEGAFAARLGPALLIHGWLDAHARLRAERARLGLPPRPASEGVGTTEYMRFAGGFGVTIECGRHDDAAAPGIGHEAIARAMAHLGLIDAPAPSVTVSRTIRLVEGFVCEAEGDRLERRWMNGEAVAAGTVIARRAVGEAIVAPSDGFLVFPNDTAKPGDPLGYFGVRSPRAL